MWLFNSSIGRKVVMSVTGLALILFLTFHGCMNIVALFSGKAYNMICELLGANWYAVLATLGLAALAVIHIVYAFILTAQNRTARGNSRYDVATTVNAGKVEWASISQLPPARRKAHQSGFPRSQCHSPQTHCCRSCNSTEHFRQNHNPHMLLPFQ